MPLELSPDEVEPVLLDIWVPVSIAAELVAVKVIMLPTCCPAGLLEPEFEATGAAAEGSAETSAEATVTGKP